MFDIAIYVTCFAPYIALAHDATVRRTVTSINSILCPGLGSAAGSMPYDKAAVQVTKKLSLL